MIDLNIGAPTNIQAAPPDYSRQLLRYLVDPDHTAYRDCRSLIFSNFSPSAFRDEAYMLYSVLYKFKERSIVLDSDFLEIYFSRHLGDFTDARRFIDLDAYASAAKEADPSMLIGDNTDRALLYAGGVIRYYEGILKDPAPTTDLPSCQLLIEKFREEFSTSAAERVLQKGLSILTNGVQEGNKILSGFDDAQEYIRRGLTQVEGVVDTSQGAGFISYMDALEQSEGFQPVERIADYGYLNELNVHFGGIYTQSLITVAAPMKGGKTKFCANLIYNAVVKHGQNVSIWPVEGSVREMMAELQAIHFDRMNNAGADPSQSKLGVSKNTILYDQWAGKEDWKEQCQLLAYDLGTNPNYGRIDFIDRPLMLETFLDDLDLSVKSNGSRMVFVDYLMLMRSRDSRLKQHEIISKAYPEALNYVKRNNITLISPAQYTQDAIKGLAGGDSSSEMRVALGGSVEITRSSDITIALWASTQDLAASRMKIMSIPSRVNRPFETFEITTDLGSCLFMSK